MKGPKRTACCALVVQCMITKVNEFLCSFQLVCDMVLHVLMFSRNFYPAFLCLFYEALLDRTDLFCLLRDRSVPANVMKIILDGPRPQSCPIPQRHISIKVHRKH